MCQQKCILSAGDGVASTHRSFITCHIKTEIYREKSPARAVHIARNFIARTYNIVTLVYIFSW